MILTGFQRKKLRLQFGFDLTSFADKIYQWCEASERRNTSASGFLRKQSRTILKLTSLV